MAPLYTRGPPSPRNFLRRTLVQLWLSVAGGQRDTSPDAALADQGDDVIGAEAGAWAEGHGFQGMCEGDYKPGRDLARGISN